MARADLDLSDLEKWADDLHVAAAVSEPAALAVVARGSWNIKREAKANAPGGRMAPHYPASITYDVETGATGEIVGEVGPAQGLLQWGLGNLLEYGSENNAPQPHLEPALDHEEPRFYAAAEALAAACVESPRSPLPKVPNRG
jgi:hypothetical protein